MFHRKLGAMRGYNLHAKELLMKGIAVEPNMPPRNLPEWYETFGVKKTDKMHIAPSRRVIIW